MKVSQNPPSYQHTIEKAKSSETAVSQSAKERGAPSQAAVSGSAQVEISDNARLMKKATEVATSAPDIRAERVAELKKAIKAGTYKVDAEAIADKLVDEHLTSDFGKNNV